MMRITFSDRQIQRDRHGIRQRTEEMLNHFGIEFTHLFAAKVGFKYQEWTTGQVDSNLSQTFIHRQQETKTTHTAFITERLFQSFTQRNCRIFYCVMIIDMQVALNIQLQAEACMRCDLIQHMIKEANTGSDLVSAGFVQIHVNADLCFFGISDHMRFAAFVQQHVTDLVPVTGFRIVADTMDTHVFCQLHISDAITDHIGVCMINATRVHVIFHNTQFGFAAGTVIMREVWANQYGFPGHALRFKDMHHQVLWWLEVFQWQTLGAQTILIGHHYQNITRSLQITQGRNDHRFKTQFIQTINLFINHRLFNQSTVAVNE
eukprot:RCo014546